MFQKLLEGKNLKAPTGSEHMTKIYLVNTLTYCAVEFCQGLNITLLYLRFYYIYVHTLPFFRNVFGNVGICYFC